ASDPRSSYEGTTVSPQGQEETRHADPTQPYSTAIAPVTIPGDSTTPAQGTSGAESASAYPGPPRTIDRTKDGFLNLLSQVEDLFHKNQVLPFDMEQMHQEALKQYVELSGGVWEEYRDALPSYGPEVTLIVRTDSEFLNRMGELQELVEERLHPTEEQIKQAQEGTIKAFVAASGDRYSDFLTAEEWASTQESSDGSYCGIGVQIMQDKETMVSTVTNVFSNSPAKEAGMLTGDVFKKVDGMDVTQMPLEQIVTYVRGHEGEPVVITVYRAVSNETLEITCVRRKVEVETVSYRMLTGTVGYLELMEFDNVTIRQVSDAVKSLIGQGMQKMILDLRGNPGGLLSSVLEVADFFTKKGTLLFRMDYKNGETYTENAVDPPLFTGEMVVLVDGGTASAGEVLTGILQDYHLATIMGEKTFGKGIVQSFFNVGEEDMLKLTIAHYYSPLGRDFHGVGIEPDVYGSDNVLTPEDELLEQALKSLE
ncbi:MAG: S41 family peptidase, partial [Lachnospiraceae bacterium]|nr:S41 family peptidase [Lachnospiraceae bacterium]